MCTNNLKPVKGSLIGWKVVKQDKVSKTVRSPIYRELIWNPNTFHHPEESCTHCCWNVWCRQPLNSCLIHCFATREQARTYYRYECGLSYDWDYRIIKVILTDAYKGTHTGMGMEGKPAHCGKNAYWDGKFHT